MNITHYYHYCGSIGIRGYQISWILLNSQILGIRWIAIVICGYIFLFGKHRLEKEVRENKYPTNIDEMPVYMHVHKCTKHHNDKFLK